jgi:hypothetical protein
MRVGINPAKFDKDIISLVYHRIVIPVYIPNHDGYFMNQFDVFKLCIQSLLRTIHDKTRITIYINSCAEDVINYIYELKKNHESIDQIFISKINMGKINALIAGIKGNIEPVVTITDADVLFKQGWQQETEHLLNSFPEAGMISPVPTSKGVRYHTANNWLYALINGKVRFEPVAEPEALIQFEKSITTEGTLYSEEHLKNYITLTNQEGVSAVWGCGHFVATMRREVFDKGSNSPAFIKIQGGVEENFIDIPNEMLGFLRLSTIKNYAHHMGNTPERWMYDVLNSFENNNIYKTIEIKPSKPFKGINLFTSRILQKLMKNKINNLIYFKILGINIPNGYL